MQFTRAADFQGEKAWDALPIANLDGITVRLHWTDQPYHWHVNDGQEVFVVLEGEIDMHVRTPEGEVQITRMKAGSIAHASQGDEHFAHPRVPSRVLVIEREGSE